MLKVDLGLAGEDCQQAVTDESLCTVTGCASGTDVYHWMFKTKVNMVQGQEDVPLRVRLTTCQQVHSDIRPAVSQMFTFLMKALVYL